MVKLAVGETHFFVNDAGTLISTEDVAPILAMVDLMEMGCRVTWTSTEGCSVWHPRRGWLPVTMNDGCPEVGKKLGLELIAEAEKVKRHRAQAELYVRELREHVKDMDFWEQGKKVVDSLPNSTDEAYKWLAHVSSGSFVAAGGDSCESWYGWTQSALESSREEEMGKGVFVGDPLVLRQG